MTPSGVNGSYRAAIFCVHKTASSTDLTLAENRRIARPSLLQSVRCPLSEALKLDWICLLPVIRELQLLAPLQTVNFEINATKPIKLELSRGLTSKLCIAESCAPASSSTSDLRHGARHLPVASRPGHSAHSLGLAQSSGVFGRQRALQARHTQSRLAFLSSALNPA